MDLKSAEAEFAADVAEPFTIALSQFPLRTLLQPADGNDDDAHKSIFRQSMPSDLIRGWNPVCLERDRQKWKPVLRPIALQNTGMAHDLIAKPLTLWRIMRKMRQINNSRAFQCALQISMRSSRFTSAILLDRLRRRRALRPQSFQIVEFAHLGSEHVHDHVAGIDQHPVTVGQALDVDAFDSGFLETFGDIFRDRADVPVSPARGDDHVVGKWRFAAKVDGDRFFRLHIVEAGEGHILPLVGVRWRLYSPSLRLLF